MFDTVCKFLIEKFPEDFATWLLGEPMELAIIKPSELSLEPIRADALILLESKNLILHLEAQTLPKSNIPYRMLDYRVRGHRRFPDKQMRQVVIYLKPTRSELAWQTTFELENTQHQFEVIRLWEQPSEAFLNVPGLLPFAVLSQTENKEAMLRQVAKQIQTLPTREEQGSITAITAILSALVLEEEAIQKILRSDIMQESSVYLSIIEKGLAEGRAEGLAEGIQNQRRMILRLLNRLFGSVSEANRSRIDRLSEPQLEDLAEATVDFSDVEDLSTWLRDNLPSA